MMYKNNKKINHQKVKKKILFVIIQKRMGDLIIDLSIFNNFYRKNRTNRTAC